MHDVYCIFKISTSVYIYEYIKYIHTNEHQHTNNT